MRLTPRVAGFRLEYPAGFELECMAGFIGTRNCSCFLSFCFKPELDQAADGFGTI